MFLFGPGHTCTHAMFRQGPDLCDSFTLFFLASVAKFG